MIYNHSEGMPPAVSSANLAADDVYITDPGNRSIVLTIDALRWLCFVAGPAILDQHRKETAHAR